MTRTPERPMHLHDDAGPSRMTSTGASGLLRCSKAALVVALGLVGACGLLEPEVSETGVVTFLDIEGGCWVIETDAETYLPIDLPSNLRHDGLNVQFEGEIREEISSPCPGRPLDLIFIESLVGGGGG